MTSTPPLANQSEIEPSSEHPPQTIPLGSFIPSTAVSSGINSSVVSNLSSGSVCGGSMGGRGLLMSKPRSTQPLHLQSKIWRPAGIRVRKAAYRNLSRDEKILLLAKYAPCKANACNCAGWNTYNAGRNASFPSNNGGAPGIHSGIANEICGHCTHPLEQHVADLTKLTDVAINDLIGAMVDMEMLFLVAQKDPPLMDHGSKHIFYYLFRLLKKCVSTCRSPLPDFKTLGRPPYEEQTISRAVKALIELRYSHCNSVEWEAVSALSNILLYTINKVKMESPSVSTRKVGKASFVVYNRMYQRWLILCEAPRLYDSLPKYEVVNIFGLQLLKEIFQTVKQQILEKFRIKRDPIEPTKRELYSRLLPEFLEAVKDAIKNPNCPVWDANFRPVPPAHPQHRSQLQSAAQQVPNSMTVVSATAKVATPTANLPGLKLEPDDMAEGDDMEVDFDICHTLEQDASGGIKDSPFDDFASTGVRKEESHENLSCVVIDNLKSSTVSKETRKWLNGLAKVFSDHLPKMSKDYIKQLMFDKKHRNLILIKEDRPIGGICFKIFRTQGFTEVVFLGVSEQRQGYGKRLMNELKNYHIKLGCLHFLTYADNFATDFFEKLQFKKKITLPRKLYKSVIKEYVGAKLMQCDLNRSIRYTELTTVNQTFTNPGPSKKDEQKITHVPGLKEASQLCGIDSHNFDISNESKLRTALISILNEVKKHDASWPFLKPVDKNEVPDYYDIIPFPMDLQTIEDRLKRGYYIHRKLFIVDMITIFNNCRTYFSLETEHCRCAKLVEKFFNSKLRKSGLAD